MEGNSFMTAQEVAKELNISQSFSYKLIRKLNAELEKKGIITIPGRVNRQYFKERLYYEASRAISPFCVSVQQDLLPPSRIFHPALSSYPLKPVIQCRKSHCS